MSYIQLNPPLFLYILHHSNSIQFYIIFEKALRKSEWRFQFHNITYWWQRNAFSAYTHTNSTFIIRPTSHKMFCQMFFSIFISRSMSMGVVWSEAREWGKICINTQIFLRKNFSVFHFSLFKYTHIIFLMISNMTKFTQK